MEDGVPPLETLDQVQARHRREKKDLQGRITSKKKNATKKTRKGVNDECAALEYALAEKHAAELAVFTGSESDHPDDAAAAAAAGNHLATSDAVVEKLASVSLENGVLASEPPPSPPPPPQQQQQQPEQKRRRNRQKERLARRAAEQQSLAAEAATEAAHMSDHRGLERAALAPLLAARGLAEHDVPADGHCLFSAVADQVVARGYAADIPALAGARVGYRQMRVLAAQWIRAHAHQVAPFLEEPVDEYARKMQDTAEWGGQVELQALAEACGLEIHVVQKSGEQVIKPAEGGEGRRIWVGYYLHGFGLGEHYNSLRDKKE
ncbi:hypothetical protein TD95_000921 [Thielaviopsis punctulata]|uniref:OTU domain-containing protein n=1 Tax=Thielaviopsis punctulata TaxID=72032 RepID=A0A0F4ZGF4_9PEZI|nr:hypothetical protein TD95_000921 [Thielaviopsis punctulata]